MRRTVDHPHHACTPFAYGMAAAGWNEVATRRALRDIQLGHVTTWTKEFLERQAETTAPASASFWLHAMARGRRSGRGRTSATVYAK